MTDYDRERNQDRYTRRDRYERRSYSQQEQFDDYDSDQYGDRSNYDHDQRGRSSYSAGSERGSYDRGRDRSYGGEEFGRSRGSDQYQNQDRYSGSYGSDRYGSDRFSNVNRGRSEHGSYRGSSTGRSYHEPSSYDQLEYGGGSSGRSHGRSRYADHDRSYRGKRSDERGFFEKAGDEVASWFGDEDAERRRRMDHSGRGPSNYRRSDERLLEEACERLTHDWGIDASSINVSADNNEITLDGTVDSRRAKRRAEDCVHDISGVRHVQNNLRVKESDRYANYTDTSDTSGGDESTKAFSDTAESKTA